MDGGANFLNVWISLFVHYIESLRCGGITILKSQRWAMQFSILQWFSVHLVLASNRLLRYPFCPYRQFFYGEFFVRRWKLKLLKIIYNNNVLKKKPNKLVKVRLPINKYCAVLFMYEKMCKFVCIAKKCMKKEWAQFTYL